MQIYANVLLVKTALGRELVNPIYHHIYLLLLRGKPEEAPLFSTNQWEIGTSAVVMGFLALHIFPSNVQVEPGTGTMGSERLPAIFWWPETQNGKLCENTDHQLINIDKL